MVRLSVFFGIAALLALAVPAYAQEAATAPPVRLTPPTEQPRYATMNPPTDEVVPANNAPAVAAPPAAAPPTAAPTTPIETRSIAAQPADNSVPAQPRYATMATPETITITGLRPSGNNSYLLGTGDTVRVTVFGEEDLSGQFQIDGQGFVRLPLIGQVSAAGLTTFGLETRIASVLVTGDYILNPRVSVEVTTYRPFYIIGEVAKPGEYPYVNAMTAPNAIALAGGYTDRAVKSTIYVRHQGETAEREMPAGSRTRIVPGDVVRVERSTYWSIMTLLTPIIYPFSSIAYLLK